MVKARKPPDPYETTLAECLSFMNKRMFKEKRTRQDVSDRIANNKDLTCTVVKTTWNSFCKPEAARLDITGCLFEVNKATLEAYVLANLHVIRMCEAGLPLVELNQSFFYKCLSAVSSGHRKSPEISELQFRKSAEIYNSWRAQGCAPPDSSHLGSGWYQQASQQMTTMTKNSVSMNFYRRFKNYLKCRYDLDGKQAYEALCAIRADQYAGDDEIVLRYRALYPAKPRKGQREDFPELVMPLQHRFLQYQQSVHAACEAENRHIPKHCRLFSLIPTKQGFECSHLKMCTNGLQGLLRRSKIESVQGHKIPSSVTEFRQLAEDVLWHHFFNIEDFETVNRKFGGEILLDGKAVSIVLKKPKTVAPKASKQVKLSLEDYDEMWGLDPGRREVFVASNEQQEVKRLSTKQFYHEAKYKASNRKIESWHKLNDEIAESITKVPSKKTSDVASLQAYMQFLFPKLDLLLRFHMQKGYRDLKFRRYVLKQKKLNEICDSLTEKCGKRTLIGFGDWSNKDSAGVIKKSPAGPVKQLERELSKRCKVVSVDEFRSSKLHEKCHCELQKTYRQKADKNGVLRRVKVHSVLFCSNRSCNGMRVNRDVNASRNMLALLKQQLRDGSRPEAFRRSVHNEFLTTPTTSARAETSGLSGLVPSGAGLRGRCRARGNARQPAAPLLPEVTV